jgi:hypothetical protein
MGVPAQLCEPFTVWAYSLGQYLTARIVAQQDITNPLSVIGSSLVLASFHTIHAMLIHIISKYVPFFPEHIIGLVISYKSSEIMHEFIRFGFEAGVYCLFEKVLSFFRLFQNDIGELPLDSRIPQCLTCNICKELLTDPVESLGFFFCRGCFDAWVTISGSWIHPVTGEQISESQISRPAVLEVVARKYHRILQSS